ncbi:MAG: phage tail protein [Cohaesibacter sp.]|nr:phage tail protein [Cohaesibacter sp.]
MSQIFVIDGIAFEGYDLGNLTIAEKVSTGAVRKQILGGKARHEKVREGDLKISLAGKIAPKEFGGLQNLNHLKIATKNSEPVFMTRGRFEPLGWFIVTNGDFRHRHIDVDGIGRLIDFTIELEETDRPAAGSGVFGAVQRFTSIVKDIVGGLPI